jgi:hypothetical protein
MEVVISKQKTRKVLGTSSRDMYSSMMSMMSTKRKTAGKSGQGFIAVDE